MRPIVLALLVTSTTHGHGCRPPSAADLAAAASALELERRPHWLGEVGAYVGDAHIEGSNASTSTAAGLHGAFGIRDGRFSLHGELAAVQVREELAPQPATGVLYRYGLAARVALWQHAESTRGCDHCAGFVEVLADAGAGHETIVWDGGGRRSQLDLALGLGVQTSIRLGEHSFGGLYSGLRAHLATGQTTVLFDVAFVWGN